MKRETGVSHNVIGWSLDQRQQTPLSPKNGKTICNPFVTSPRTQRTRRTRFGHPLPKSVLPTSKSDQPKMDALIAEVAELRLQLQQLQTQTGKKSPCQGVTGKGTPCRNGASPGTSHCRMHSRPTKEAKPPRTRKEPKPKKIVPEHTHPIGESHPHRALCQTHLIILSRYIKCLYSHPWGL